MPFTDAKKAHAVAERFDKNSKYEDLRNRAPDRKGGKHFQKAQALHYAAQFQRKRF